jgi:hypothetical protein
MVDVEGFLGQERLRNFLEELGQPLYLVVFLSRQSGVLLGFEGEVLEEGNGPDALLGVFSEDDLEDALDGLVLGSVQRDPFDEVVAEGHEVLGLPPELLYYHLLEAFTGHCRIVELFSQKPEQVEDGFADVIEVVGQDAVGIDEIEVGLQEDLVVGGVGEVVAVEQHPEDLEVILEVHFP